MTEEIKTEVQVEAKSLLEQANEAADRLRAENDRAEALLAKATLGGQTFAGTTTPVPIDPIQAEKDKINEMLKTTGLHI